MIKPTEAVPALKVETVGGGKWNLADQTADSFTVIEFYRGYHCPRCKLQLIELDQRVGHFASRGCGVVAISMDSAERAEKTKQEWGLGGLTLGYGLSEDSAREWGLYISQSIQDKEPNHFCEPGLFLVQPDGTLFSSVLYTTPFHRHHIGDVLEGIEMIKAKNYPARGNV